MATTHGAGSHASLAVLEIVRANPSHDPILFHGSRRIGAAGQLIAGQGGFRRVPIFLTANPLALLIKQGDPFLGARQREIPAVGLRPMPSRTERTASLAFGSCHLVLTRNVDPP